MIEQPRKQTLRDRGDWFYSICSCGKLVAVTDGIIPQHNYTIPPHPEWGIPGGEYPCSKSLTLHSTHQ